MGPAAAGVWARLFALCILFCCAPAVAGLLWSGVLVFCPACCMHNHWGFVCCLYVCAPPHEGLVITGDCCCMLMQPQTCTLFLVWLSEWQLLLQI